MKTAERRKAASFILPPTLLLRGQERRKATSLYYSLTSPNVDLLKILVPVDTLYYLLPFFYPLRTS